MSAHDTPRDADFESASSRLSAGLKSCRGMIADYRAMLGGESEDDGDTDSDMSRYFSSTSDTDAGHASGSESA